MNRTHLWTAVWIAAMTFSTLSYQQCSPAKFSAAEQPTLAKAGADTDDVVGQGDGAPAEPGDDDGAPSDEVCVDRQQLQIEHQDGIPVAACPKNSAEKCAVICHVPPGNPAAQHTILISPNAVQAHMNHGAKAQAASHSPASADAMRCSDKEPSKDQAKNPSNLPEKDYLGECKSPSSDAKICQS